MNIKYLVKDGSGDLYVPIYPFHQETYELAGGGPGSNSLANKKLRIAVTINITNESRSYTLLNYGYFLIFSEIEVLGERHTFPISGQSPFTWQFDKPGEYTFYVTLRPEFPSAGPVFYGIQDQITSISLPYGIETLPPYFFQGISMPNVDIVLPSSVKYLKQGEVLFGGCRLHKLVIPKNCIVNSGTLSGCAPEILEFHGTFIDAETVPFGMSYLYLGIDTSCLKKVIIDCRNTKIVSSYNMSACEEIEVSGNVETILGGCFGGCSLVKKITLSGNKLKEIQNGAFGGCSSLVDISIADSVEDILPGAFSSCSSLKYIKLPSSLKVLRTGVLNNNGIPLETVVLPERLEEILSNAFAGISTLKNVNIPSAITTIPTNCFAGTGLLNIDIPNSIITIGSSAFASCSNLKQAEIPNSVLRIESRAFNGCSNLESIEGLDSVCYFASGCFAGCIKLNLGHITIPSALDGGYVSSNAFDRTKIISLTNNYEYVNTSLYGFVYGCSDLVTVVNNATTGGTTAEILGYGRTQYNTSLKQVVTNDKSLAYLSNFPALETIVMSNPEVTFSLGNGNVFNNSPNLKDIYIYNKTAPELGGSTFNGCAENVKVHVPANATGYEAWVDGSTQWYYPYKLHWEIVKDLDPVFEQASDQEGDDEVVP